MNSIASRPFGILVHSDFADKTPSLTWIVSHDNPGRFYSKLLKMVWNDVQRDDLVDLAAQMSFYFVLSLFPFLLVVAAVIGWLPSTTLWHDFAQWITDYLPGDARKLVFSAVLELTKGYGSFFSIGLAGTVWAASTGVVSLMDSLNITYDTKETRGYWRRRAIAIVTTCLAAFFFVASFVTMALGHWAVTSFSTDVRRIQISRVSIEIARWLVTLLLMCLALDLMNEFLPNRDRPWRSITPGRLFVAIMFVLASFGFNIYLRYFANYPRVYGALAAFIVLMMWIYIASLILLIGAEIDNSLEHLKRGESA